MGVPSWVTDPASWDRIEINGFVFEETKVEVDGDFGNDFDIKKAPGADGATLTNKGVEPIKPQIKWVIYNDAMWGTYQALLAKVYPYPGKTPLPLLEVIHPQLLLLKKAQFRLVRVHTLKPVGPEMMQAQFDLLEYFKQAKKVQPPAPPIPDRNSADRGERPLYDIDFQKNKPSNKPKP